MQSSSNIILKGLPSSSGTCIGNAVIITTEFVFIPTEEIAEYKIDDEKQRFLNAIESLKSEFSEILKKLESEEQENIADIIGASLMMIEDVHFISSVQKQIENRQSAENSLVMEIDFRKKYFLRSKDRILREKAFELDNLKERLLYILRNKSKLGSIVKGSVVVAKSITPTDIVKFKEIGIAGIVTELGGIASHTSILARSFEIPAVIGVTNAVKQLDCCNEIIVDGYSGLVVGNPKAEFLDNYRKKKEKEEAHKKELGALLKLESKTKDGVRITLLVNVDFPHDVESSILVGSEGVGLVRTEHMIFGSNIVANEERQHKLYSDLANRTYPNIVTFRAFDVGSDKYAVGIPFHEDNPSLGFRGIRFLLSNKNVFETQIRAILRASSNNNIRLMLPMISNMRELVAAKEIINKCKADLEKKNIDFDKDIPVGIMIETPSSALLADKFAKVCDFFSIGTNDLTQYTLAADRSNEHVADIFDSFHPSVLKLIKISVDAANKNNIPVGICGEIAGHSASTALIIGLGLRELSVPPSILLELKSRIRNVDSKKAKKMAKKATLMSCQQDVMEIINNI